MKIEVSFKTHCGEKPKNEMICPYEEVVIGVGRVTIINNIFRSIPPATITITNHIIIIRIIIITISIIIFIFYHGFNGCYQKCYDENLECMIICLGRKKVGPKIKRDKNDHMTLF